MYEVEITLSNGSRTTKAFESGLQARAAAERVTQMWAEYPEFAGQKVRVLKILDSGS